MSELKLEVGKYYVTQRGMMAFVSHDARTEELPNWAQTPDQPMEGWIRDAGGARIGMWDDQGEEMEHWGDSLVKEFDPEESVEINGIKYKLVSE